MTADPQPPRPRRTNVFIEAWDHVKYPIVAPIPSISPSTAVAVVAVVTATDAKIDFTISVENALKVSIEGLLYDDSWIEDFYVCFREQSGINVKGGVKGWTTAILREAMHPYRVRFRTKPRCMIGVFNQINLEIFLEQFDARIPAASIRNIDPTQLFDTAANCIQYTPFWKPRRELGFTRLMFDESALRKRNVFVRAFRDDLDQDEINAIATNSPKLFDVPDGKWGFSYGGRPFAAWGSGNSVDRMKRSQMEAKDDTAAIAEPPA